MRFILLLKTTDEAAAGTLREAELRARVASFQAQLDRAGALLDTALLAPGSAAWRIRQQGSSREVVAGPFAATELLVAGYTLIQARNHEEALEWAKRFPEARGDGRSTEIELRALRDGDR